MTIYFTPNETIKKLVNTIFNYKGRTYRVEKSNFYLLENYWSGGSRKYCALVNRDSLSYSFPKTETTNPMLSQAHQTIEIPSNHFIIEHTIFRGKDLGIRFISREDELDPVLVENNNVNLTIIEKIVLYCFQYKSSYGGIKNYRKYIAVDIITAEEYDIGLTNLKEKGLVNSRNALTIEGKNKKSFLPDLHILKEEYTKYNLH